MVYTDMILYVIKLVLGGTAAFLAIMLGSKTRDAAWIVLVAGTLIGYAGLIYDMLCIFGIIDPVSVLPFSAAGIPPISLFFAVVPPLFFISAFLIVIKRKRL